MPSDVYTDLQIVNATRRALYPGNGGDNQGGCHSHRMEWWFGSYRDNKKYARPIAAAREGRTYRLQFLNGADGQDEGAGMQLNVGDANMRACNVVHLKARSDDRNARRIWVDVQEPRLPCHGPFAVAFCAQGAWPADGAQALRWYAAGQSFETGTPGGPQCLAVMDLQLWFPPDIAGMLVRHIRQESLGRNDAGLLWANASHYLDLD